MKFTIKLTTLIIGTLMLANVAHAQSPREQLKQMVEELQKSPNDSELRKNIINAAKTITPPPALPEETTRRVARGIAAFKDAKSLGDYKDAVAEFEKATLAAPWYADAYYNLAQARAKAEDYAGASASLKLYLLAAPGAKDAADAKTLMYEMEYKQEKADKERSAAQANAREYQEKIGFLAGQWAVSSIFYCPCAWNNRVYQWTDVITIKDKNIFIANAAGELQVKGTITGDDYTSIKWSAVPGRAAQEGARRSGQAYPDYPIEVTVEKNPLRISWKEPQAAVAGGWSWDSSNKVELKK